MAQRRVRFWGSLVVAGVLLATSCSSGGDSAGDGDDTSSSDAATVTLPEGRSPIELRPLHASNGRIVDDAGRTVLLRGANVNALGDYYQGDPDRSPVAPVTDDDWAAMAANGFSVVRLIMSWSAVEPERGVIDSGYLDDVAAAVSAANEHGIYVVLDMHQDAWGKYIATPDGERCPDGLEEAIGWDGAPEWATLTDGESTCRDGGRESAPAVKAAFRNFYGNTDGIRDSLAAVWGAIAERFAGIPGVAGYELLNEPNQAEGSAAEIAGYNQFVVDALAAIRAAEAAADAPASLVFVEPLVLFPLPDTQLDGELLDDPNLVFAPHNYAESIGPKILTVEQTMTVDVDEAVRLGGQRDSGEPWPLWIGEYGYWDTTDETLAVARRYAAAEDAALVGGAWWQWRQTCGDPHAVGTPGGVADHPQVHLLTRECPADVDAGPTEPFLDILGRAYPRATPGVLSSLSSDPLTGAFEIAATDAEPDGEVVVWVPRRDRGEPPAPVTEGVDIVGFEEVAGGWILNATVTAPDYTVSLR